MLLSWMAKRSTKPKFLVIRIEQATDKEKVDEAMSDQAEEKEQIML